MRNFIAIIFLFSLIFISCGKSEYDKAKELYEIGDYKSASELLIKHLQENPKDVSSRELLIRCYDKNESWDSAIEQINILNTFNPSAKYEAQLAKFSALNEDYIKVKSIMEKLEKELSVLFEKKEKEFEERALKIKSFAEQEKDSLKVKEYGNQLDSLYSQYEKIKQNMIDSLNIKDVLIAEALYYLNLGKSSAPNKIKGCIESDSSNIRYLEKKVIEKINLIEKPKPNYGNVYSFNYDIRDYYSKIAELYASIGYVKEAIENYMDELYWFDNQERRASELSIDLHYYTLLKYLNENNRFEDALELYNRLKSTYKVKTQLCDSNIEYTKLMLEKQTSKEHE
ncbi:MAG: hypothetical protein IPJ03_09955 [Ignavibacteriales bacterium]|nr:hypothetical protein [Ignavibacteriales bacterium]